MPRNCSGWQQPDLVASKYSGSAPEPRKYLLDRSGWYYVKNFIENLTQLFGAVDRALDRNLTVPRLDFKPAID
jgi:hypothetical protein